jgi:gliding motility-associated-like protein
VQNAGGCWDTIRLDSIIHVPLPFGTFTLTPTAGCNPLKVCFDVTDINTQYNIWDFQDGTPFVQIHGDTCHVYTSSGTFNPICLSETLLPNGHTCAYNDSNLTGAVTVTNVINVSLNVSNVIHLPIDSILSVNVNYSGGVAPYTYSWGTPTGINCDTCTSVLIIGTGDTVSYVFTIYDANGCVGHDSILVLSEPCFQAKLIPNVFSPNGDGLNDVFYIPGVCPDEKYSLHIYDRWGVLIFSTTLRNNSWDGRTSAGVEAINGVYYFVVGINDDTYKGFVQLLR